MIMKDSFSILYYNQEVFSIMSTKQESSVDISVNHGETISKDTKAKSVTQHDIPGNEINLIKSTEKQIGSEIKKQQDNPQEIPSLSED